MRKEIIISGFGGQGIIFSGNLFCNAVMRSGKYVTCFPSYGAEVRGGTANCKIVVSTEYIGSPTVDNLDILLCLNKVSFKRFSPKLKEDGLVILNSNLYTPTKKREHIKEIPGNELAEQVGSRLVVNMVMLGAMAKITGVISLDLLKEAVPVVLTGSKQKLCDINKKALEVGFNA